MKIAYVTCVYPPYAGGIGVLAQGMATEMARRGYETSVITPTPLKDGGLADPTAGIRSAGGLAPAPSAAVDVRYFQPRIRYGNAAWMPNLIRALQGFDVVHFLYPFFGAAEFLPMIRSRTRAKIVLHHTMDAVAPGLRGAIFRLYNETLMPLIFKQAHVMITLSEDYFRECDITNVYANFPDAPPIEFVPNGVDTELFRPAQKLRTTDYVLPTVVFASGLDRAHYFKGVHVLIEAMRMLKEQGVQCRAWIIGNGKMRGEYEAHAREAGVLNAECRMQNPAPEQVRCGAGAECAVLETHIEFLGLVPHDKLPEYYRTATVAVVPSTARVECFSIVAAEAQACGIPAIVSDFPGVRVTVEDGRTGYVVRPGDPHDLAEKIKMVISDPSGAQAMGASGRARAEQLYSWKVVGEKLDHIYEGLRHP